MVIPQNMKVSSSTTVILGAARTPGRSEDEVEDPEAPILKIQGSSAMGDYVLVRE